MKGGGNGPYDQLESYETVVNSSVGAKRERTKDEPSPTENRSQNTHHTPPDNPPPISLQRSFHKSPRTNSSKKTPCRRTFVNVGIIVHHLEGLEDDSEY